jgi:hypothetical protein
MVITERANPAIAQNAASYLKDRFRPIVAVRPLFEHPPFERICVPLFGYKPM